jgi:hypothetical protein
MESNVPETFEKAVELLKLSRARKFCLPREWASCLDVMKAIVNNRSITALDLDESKVRACAFRVVCSWADIWSSVFRRLLFRDVLVL